MQRDQLLSFGPYRLDPERGQLWRGKQEVNIVPKALAVLRALVTQPVQVVTKKELFQAVWPGTVVSDATLTSCIKELRQALRDDAGRPRYIETVHRRGYRFIGAVWSPESEVRSHKSELAPSTQHPAPSHSSRFKVQSSKLIFRIPHSAIRSRSVFSEGCRYCPAAECEVMGAAGGDEPEPAVAAAEQEETSSQNVGGDLRLVHRGV